MNRSFSFRVNKLSYVVLTAMSRHQNKIFIELTLTERKKLRLLESKKHN